MPKDPEPPAEQLTDSAAEVQALELELIRQRARREVAKTRRRKWRALSFLFLLLVLLGALFAFFYFLPQLTQGHSPRSAEPSAETNR